MTSESTAFFPHPRLWMRTVGAPRRGPGQPSTTETPAGFRNRKWSGGREGLTVTSVR